MSFRVEANVAALGLPSSRFSAVTYLPHSEAGLFDEIARYLVDRKAPKR